MTKNKIENLINELPKFKHKIEGRAKFEDIDLMQVVHNQKYMYWIEDARVEFLRETLFPENDGNFLEIFPLLIVRHEIDYLGITKFNQKYQILSRIIYIGTSSMKMENVIIVENKPVAHLITTFVHMESDFSKSKEIPPAYRDKIINTMN